MLSLIPTVLLAAHLVTAALPAPKLVRKAVPISTVPVELKATTNYAPLSRVHASKKASAASAASGAFIKGYGHAHLSNHASTEVFVIEATIGGEKVPLILDTGSSDTWVAAAGFECVDGKGNVLPQADCGFGPVFNGSFPAGALPDENFQITYGNGYNVRGSFGFLDVKVSGIHVKSQQVALANSSAIVLDGAISGLMGLGYSGLTSEFVGTNATLDNQNVTGTAPGDHEGYSPIVQTMIADKLINPPLFSLALQRAKDINDFTSPGGYVAFGGLPPVALDPVFASTALEIYEYPYYPPYFANQYSFYTITPKGYVTYGSSGTAKRHNVAVPTIIDSGTLEMLLPTPVYNAYLNTVQGVVMNGGAAYAPCDTPVPQLGVNVAGTVFNISSADILYTPFNYTSESGIELCYLAIANSPDLPLIGATFLKNVVAVFDVGASVFRVAAHNY